MEPLTFDAFFQKATRVATAAGHETAYEPFDYQCRLACGDQGVRSRAEWLSAGSDCRSLLVNVPTGCGKTAAVVLAWLWNRVKLRRSDWPRRLVYCLPMRVLVEQTRDYAILWLHNLGLVAGPAEFETQDPKKLRSYTPDLTDSARVAVHVLMGGEDEDPWDLYPERDAIIIGTQDMLLSRALNRGYAASRARWPMHFGLLNNDSLWVFDEVQLMGPGLATTTQLEAFRWLLGPRNGHGCFSIWMSATMRREWLETVDFRDRLGSVPLVELTNEDRNSSEDVRKRWGAQKPLKRAKASMGDAPALAREIFERNRLGTWTIVVVNTVRRACELFDQLNSLANPGRADKRAGRQRKPQNPAANETVENPRVVLLHSRFRPGDRKTAIDRALAEPRAGGTIVVSTQVIEAGVDVSATTLFTELAPWASLVQRFGRCNRRGDESESAAVWWIDVPANQKEADDLAAPYEPQDLTNSAERLRKLKDVALRSLPDAELSFEHGHVIRRKDLVELFDTTPDLAGNDIDIDRFVRDAEDTDTRVFWRDWDQREEQKPLRDMAAPRREELCSVPVHGFRDFARTRQGKIWRWSFLEGDWERVDKSKILPGHVFLALADAGGYTPERGWDAEAQARVDPVVAVGGSVQAAADSTDADEASRVGIWQTIAEHTDDVCRELDGILSDLSVDESQGMVLLLAARWHDRGKAHEVFQNAVDDGQVKDRRGVSTRRRERPESWRGCRFVAKAPDRRRDRGGSVIDPGFWQRYERKRFRHELASALAVLDPGNARVPDDIRDLVTYLVAAHHGKVRLSLRSLPDETRPRDREGRPLLRRRFARGVWDDDHLPATNLGGSVTAPRVTLVLEPMELGLCAEEPFAGQPSWADRMIRLRDSEALGPIRLPYLEELLRAADIRASRAAERRGGSLGRK